MMMPRATLPRLALGFLVAAVAVWFAFNRDRLDPALIERAIHGLGVWAPLGHIVLFALATILFVPGAIFGLIGGALFGPLLGAVLSLTGANLGAAAAFLVARYVAADWIRRKASGRLDRLITGVEAEGWRFVAFVRLVPLFPFNLTNYALGLTRISLKHYVLASLVSMVPGTLAFTWLGYAGREAAAGNTAAIRYGLVALALLAAMAFLPRLLRRLRGQEQPQWIEVDELASRLKESRGIVVIDVRGPDEFESSLGHIADASNMPVNELPKRMLEIDAFKDRSVVLVCRTDKRSTTAAMLLRDAGFRDVGVLRGGMEQWHQKALPVERSRIIAPTSKENGMSDALPVDAVALRKEVSAKYRDVATNPHGSFHFHTGRPLARRLDYDEAIVARMPESAIEAFAGVGNPFSQGALNPGERAVDLGSGGGFDCFVAAEQVGPKGSVVGVDMTEEMLERSRAVAAAMGLGNIEFRKGIIEDLPVEDGWADVVISNGVINLCADKRRVFSEIMRVLRPGGRLQFADIANGKEVPAGALRKIDLWTD
jgi:uncharacterized membrane protein YdjX (TVP38/TMEM64 family)/rhodanese-related sulfurtransferase/2-polyprenyl-3-methyl-5-hydroxy-6-metoxy-1,4-benzoquinol methylase